MIFTILLLLVLFIFAIAFIPPAIKYKRLTGRWSWQKAPEPKYRTETVINYLADTENADRFYKYYQTDLEENDEYNRTARELKEDYDYEKVWRYEPFELPYRLEGSDVYSQLGDEWLKVGRLKKNADLNGKTKLYFYVNEYKYVTEDGIEREKGDHYFGIETKREVEISH